MRRLRLYLTAGFPTISFWFIVTIALLALFFVFTLPSPFRPKTSVGLMNGLALIFLVITIFVKRQWVGWLRLKRWSQIHIGVFWYVVAVFLSLLFAEIIQDATPVRLLLTGAIMFFLVQAYRPTEGTKRAFIHVLGIYAVFIAVISLLQLAFPDVMNAFANQYFYGREAYGLTIELDRGRLLHWGALILIFPFFYSSTLLLRWKERIWSSLYVFLGYTSIIAAMTMSNFRWTFAVFIMITVVYFGYALRLRLVSLRRVVLLCALLSVVLEAGVVIASYALGYSLMDRFLLRNAQRDIIDTSGRILLYDQATTVFLANPVVGVGYGNYYSVVSPFPLLQLFRKGTLLRPMPVPLASHNEFFTVLAETGIVGFIGFLLVLYFTVKRAYLLMHRMALSPINRLLALSVWTSILSFSLYVLFENMFPQNIIYILIVAGIIYGWFENTRRSYAARN